MGIGKRLEVGLKNAATASLRPFLVQAPRSPRPSYARILFIRYGGIGDMILSLPVFRATRARFPQAQIDVLCDRKNVDPILGIDLVDHIDVFEKQPHRIARTVARLRQRRYEYICNLVVYPSFTFGALARLIGPQAVRAAGDQERFSYFYDRLIELPPKGKVHMLERLFRVAADLTGPDAGPGGATWVEYDREVKTKAEELFSALVAELLPTRDPPRVAVLNLSAGIPRREWPLERYAEFLRIVIDKYNDVIDGWALVTDPHRHHEAARLARMVKSRFVTTVPVVEDFRVLMELLRHAHLLVTPDTSLAHAASAVGTPVVDLMIGENATTWAPVGVPHRIVVSEDPLNLRELPVKDVLEGFDDLLTLMAARGTR